MMIEKEKSTDATANDDYFTQIETTITRNTSVKRSTV